MKSNINTCLIALAMFAALAKVHGAPDSPGDKMAQANDAWYAANSNNIHIKLTGINHQTASVTNSAGQIESPKTIQIVGTIENLSDETITAVVLDIGIVNATNKQEALRERILIATKIYKSETFNLPVIKTAPYTRDSELIECMNRLGNFTLSYNVVSVIGEKNGALALSGEYHNPQTFWRPVGQ